MLLDVPGRASNEDSSSKNGLLMAISPITNFHLQIFDQNFKKKTARLHPLPESLFPMQLPINKPTFDSISESEAKLTHDYLNNDLTSNMTPAKMTTLAASIVEKLRLNP